MLYDIFDSNENQEDISLKNLAKNILLKKQQLGISLAELSKVMNVSYLILTKIVNNTSAMPNFATLLKIARFFNVQVPDILKYGELPQYVPKFSSLEYSLISNFLRDKKVQHTQLEFIESFINDKAFAIGLELEFLKNITNVTFIFSPANKFYVGKYYLIKLLPDYNKDNIERYFFIEVINEIENNIIALPILLSDKQSVEPMKFQTHQIEILGIAVRQKMNSKI